MPDQRLRYRIEADDSKAVASTTRLNRGFRDLENSAVAAASRITGALDSTSRALIRTAEAFAAIIIAERAFSGLARSITAATRASVEHNGALSTTLNVYRAARIILSPNLFTATAIAAGFAIEGTIRLVRERQRLIEQDALLAAQEGRRYSSVSTHSSAERLLGLDRGAINSTELGRYSPADVVGFADQFAKIADPVERSREAVRLFGADAEKVLPLLGDRLRQAVIRADELSDQIDTRTRVSLANLARDLGEPGRALDRLADSFRSLAEAAKNKILITVAVAYEAQKGVLGGRPSLEQTLGLLPQTPKPAIPSDLEFKGLIDEDLAERLKQQLPTAKGTGLASGRAANRYFGNSLEGLSAELSAARSRVATLSDAFGRATGNLKGVIGESLAQALRQVQQLEPRVRELEALAKLSQFEYREGENAVRPRGPSLYRQGEPGREGAPSAGTLIVPSDSLVNGGENARSEQLRAILNAEEQKRIAAQRELIEIGREQLDFEERRIELLAGPRGEVAATERIAQLRLAAIERERSLGVDEKTLSREVIRVQESREIRLLEISRKRFDDIKSQAGSLFDALITRTHSFGQELAAVLRTALLTPVKDAVSTAIAGLLTGRSVATGNVGGGILGSVGAALGGGFGGGGVSYPGAPGGTSGFAGPVNVGLALPTGGFGFPGGLGGAVAQGGLLARLGLGSGSSLGLLGLGGAALGLQGAFALNRRGTAGRVLGPALGAASGLLGFGALASLFPALIGLGPIGFIAAGAIGGLSVLIRGLFGSATDKARDKIRSVWGVDISDKRILEQVVGIAKNSFGGNLDVAVRSAQIQELAALYAMSTGQRIGAPGVATASTLIQSGGSLGLAPSYYNGSPIDSIRGGFASNAGAAQPIVLSLDGAATTRLLRGEVVEVARSEPRVFQQAAVTAARGGFRRRESLSVALGQPVLTS